MKKVLLGLGAAGITLAMIPLFAAFEAHVVNVTARIENALTVPVTPINFGTVFPQEQLAQTLPIALSRSFLDEPRVDDVRYIIRQKPKCGVTSNDGTVLDGPTWTGHVVVTPVLDAAGATVGYTSSVDCEQDKPKDLQLGQGQTAGLLPSLCEYISKHPDNQPVNDGSLNSFHKPYTINQQTGAIVWTDVAGYLAQSAQDILDVWTIDLKVPCFGGYCAQDWADFVHGINPDANPAEYTQPISNEHKVFGCNLWVEVRSVSESEASPE